MHGYLFDCMFGYLSAACLCYCTCFLEGVKTVTGLFPVKTCKKCPAEVVKISAGHL